VRLASSSVSAIGVSPMRLERMICNTAAKGRSAGRRAFHWVCGLAAATWERCGTHDELGVERDRRLEGARRPWLRDCFPPGSHQASVESVVASSADLAARFAAARCGRSVPVWRNRTGLHRKGTIVREARAGGADCARSFSSCCGWHDCRKFYAIFCGLIERPHHSPDTPHQPGSLSAEKLTPKQIQ
jgi:hypothetical protein